MRIVFFEVQDWEKEKLKKSFPKSSLVKEKLTSTIAKEYKSVEIISTFIYSALNKQTIDKLDNLKFIATRSTGYDHIDISYCKNKNIKISNVPEYGSRTVAEHTFALILTLSRKIYQSITQTKQLNFNHQNIKGIDLSKKTIGIIGLGKIGLEVLKLAKGFNMKVLVFTKTKYKELSKKWGFEYVDFDYLIKNSDFITLHLPHTKKTYHLINKKNILNFKKGSYLVNTSRGELIETEAILLSLEKGILEGVALDVLEGEKNLREEVEILAEDYKKSIDLKTLLLDHLLINHPKIIITPHNAFNSSEALLRILKTTIKNINGYLDSKPVNLVNSKI